MATPTQPLNISTEVDVIKKRRWIGNGVATFIIAVLVISLFGSYVFAVTFWPTASTMGKEQQGIIIGVLVSAFSGVVGYYCGSSLGSANKSVELAAKK